MRSVFQALAPALVASFIWAARSRPQPAGPTAAEPPSALSNTVEGTRA